MENPTQRSERAGFWPWIFRVIAPHAAVVLVLLTLIRAWLPPFWGSPGLAFKIEHVLEANEPFDRVFIGSSHLFRQVDPQVLDSAINDGGHSFNMALNACFAPESEMACEYVLNNSATPPKVICLELMPYVLFEEKNFDHYRYWYYLDPSTCSTLVRHTWGMPSMRRSERAKYSGQAIRAFVYASSLSGLLDRFFGDGFKVDTPNVMGPRGNGTVPFDWQVLREPQNDELKQRIENLQRDTAELGRRRNTIVRSYDGKSNTSFSKVHLSRIERLMRLGDQRGVKVLFVLPPLWIEHGEDALALFHALPKDRRIDLCDPAKFPEFYQTQNAFDIGHLNARGSRLFSKRLAERLSELTSNSSLPVREYLPMSASGSELAEMPASLLEGPANADPKGELWASLSHLVRFAQYRASEVR